MRRYSLPSRLNWRSAYRSGTTLIQGGSRDYGQEQTRPLQEGGSVLISASENQARLFFSFWAATLMHSSWAKNPNESLRMSGATGLRHIQEPRGASFSIGSRIAEDLPLWKVCGEST